MVHLAPLVLVIAFVAPASTMVSFGEAPGVGVGVGVVVVAVSLGAGSSGTIGVPPPLTLLGPWLARISVCAMICAPYCSMPRINGSLPLTSWSAWKVTVLPDPAESRIIAPWSCNACHSMFAPALAAT